MTCDELKVYVPQDGHYGLEPEEGGEPVEEETCYLKSEADKFISDLEESHKKEVGQLLIEVAELKYDYKEACDRLQTANLIKDEQKAKVTKLLGCLKYLVMRDLIKDCPPKKVAAEIVKECDNGLV